MIKEIFYLKFKEKKEFNSNITKIALNNNYMSILSDGKIHFIRLETDNIVKIFPLKDTEDQIYYICMTEDYLIYSDSNGRIKIYSIFYNCLSISDYKFENPIKKIFPGTKYLCIVEIGHGFLYNPINKSILPLYNDIELNRVIWVQEDNNFFVGITNGNSKVYSFYIILNSLQEPYVRIIKEFSYLEDLDNNKTEASSTSLENGSYPFYLKKFF